MEYIRANGAPECIFHNQHKTLHNLLSPDPAVSCVRDKPFSHRVLHAHVYTICIILLFFILEAVISFLAMDAFTWEKWTYLAAFLLDFFSK